MKKLVVLPLIVVVTALGGSIFSPSLAQAPANADTPTFYHLVPGTYVNGWPRCTIQYPKEWAEALPHAAQVFQAAPGPAWIPCFGVSVGPSPLPLEKFLDFILPFHKATVDEVTVVIDKPTRLRDGTPAREVEFEEVANGAPLHVCYLATEKSGVTIAVLMMSPGKKTDEELKAYLYSLKFQPGFDESVKVPPDVQAFLDEYRSAAVAHDMDKVMRYHSDRYLNSGMTKAAMERYHRPWINLMTSVDITITDFIPEGDKAYIAGIFAFNGKKAMITQTSIIKENGVWRWYGNQRNAISW